jgi:hypothetical protein
VLLTFEPSLSVFVAVTVTAPAVAPLHVALPRVESWALLMLTLVESETVHVASKMLPVMNEQPGGTLPMKASKCCVFPGGGAVWSTVALDGETLMERILHGSLLAVPPQLDTAKQPKIESARKRFCKRMAGPPTLERFNSRFLPGIKTRVFHLSRLSSNSSQAHALQTRESD